MEIDVKKIEVYDGRFVCRGKIVFVRTDYIENCITGYYGTNDGKGNLQLTSLGHMGDYFITPIVVSESEEINIEDLYFFHKYNLGNGIHKATEIGDKFAKRHKNLERLKILVPFEKMNYELLQNISSGYFKEGEEVFVDCRKSLYGFSDNDKAIYKFEVLLNYANIFKITKQPLIFTESDMRMAYEAGHLQKGKDGESFSKWIENYNNEK